MLRASSIKNIHLDFGNKSHLDVWYDGKWIARVLAYNGQTILKREIEAYTRRFLLTNPVEFERWVEGLRRDFK
jgi:hypothetical protein